jgi:hypothetical protein
VSGVAFGDRTPVEEFLHHRVQALSLFLARYAAFLVVSLQRAEQ